MKKVLALLLCLTVLLSFSLVAFGKDASFSDSVVANYSVETSNGYAFVFPPDCQVDSSTYSVEDLYKIYREAIGDSSKIILFSFSGPNSATSYLRFTVYILDAASFRTSSKVYSGITYYQLISTDCSSLTFLPFSAGVSAQISAHVGVLNAYTNSLFFVAQGTPTLPSSYSVINDISYFEFISEADFSASASHVLTVNYKYSDGTPAAESVTQEVEAGAEYSIESPAVPGYTPDIPIVTGIMPDEDLTVDVTYTKRLYQLTVKYQYEDGTKALEDAVSSYFAGWTYSVESPELEGYLPDKALVSGTMPAQDVTETVTYREVVIPQYTLTISYQYEDGSQALENAQYRYPEGTSYSIPTPAIEGYNADKAVVTGVMPGSDLSLTVTYKKDSAMQPGPGGDRPGEGGNPWENFNTGPKYDPFNNPFSPDNKGSSGSNPFLGLLNGILGFNDPFAAGNSFYSGYDPFHDAFSPNNVDGSGSNPYSGLWETISGFSDPVTGR